MMKPLRSISSLWIIAGLLALVPPIGVSAESIEDYIAEAEKAFDRSDIVSAIANYRKAAEAGNVSAQNRLAYLLNVSEQNQEAIAWYQKAAAAGSAEAEFHLAGMYAEGDGTAQDLGQALSLFTSAANKGYPPAIHVMAAAYENGEMGLRVDYEAAREWLDRGIQLNDPWAIERLAKAYSNGELGLRIDRQEAARLEQRAAGLKQDAE
jgi:TPR repeat protein